MEDRLISLLESLHQNITRQQEYFNEVLSYTKGIIENKNAIVKISPFAPTPPRIEFKCSQDSTGISPSMPDLVSQTTGNTTTEDRRKVTNTSESLNTPKSKEIANIIDLTDFNDRDSEKTASNWPSSEKKRKNGTESVKRSPKKLFQAVFSEPEKEGKEEIKNLSEKIEAIKVSPFRSDKQKLELIESHLSLDQIEASLSDEQREIVNLVLSGKNVFFTGSAGTGKTFLLKFLVNKLRATFPEKFVAVTASTGVAASQIEGTTLHSFAGMGVPSVMSDFDKLWNRKDKWRLVDILVIDEISMISGEFFDELEQTVARIRAKNRGTLPFGGVQLIISGDFLQLPPVMDASKGLENLQQIESRANSKLFLNKSFCFEGTSWGHCKLIQKTLTKVYRQEDKQFVEILNQLRKGIVSDKAMQLLGACCRSIPAENGIEPTQLYALNRDVDRINTDRLKQLDGTSCKYSSIDSVEVSDTVVEQDYERARKDLWSHCFFTQCPAAKEVVLKVGAQVMLVKNISLEAGERSLVNGSRGVVTRWIDTQVAVESLIKNLQAQYAMPLSENDEWKRILAEQQIQILRTWNQPHVPFVRFNNGVEQMVLPDMFRAELSGTGVCRRWQMPLRLAWALTIHKCQGMTLEKARISLEDIFASGHAYVAISRVRSLDGLELDKFSQYSVKVNPKVLKFYKLQESNDFPNVSPRKQVTNDKCYNCFQTGHWAKDCPKIK